MQKKTSGDAALLITEALEEYFEAWGDNADFVELALDEADISAAETAHRLTHKDVFTELRKRIFEGHDLSTALSTFVLRRSSGKDAVHCPTPLKSSSRK